MQESTETNPCPRCAHENTADAHYCGNCGLSINGLCPTCGTQNASSTHFCGNCGFDFATAAPQEPSTAPASTDDLRSQHAPVGTGAPVQGSVPPQFGPASVDCPRCHHANEPGAAFCFNCGLPFDGATGFRQGNIVGSIPAYVGARPAGFLIRLVAFIIDNIVTAAAVSILIAIFTEVSPGDYIQGADSSDGSEIISLVLNIGYAPILLGIWATTIGKRAFNVYVLKLDGTPVGFWRALGREMAKIVSMIPFGAGFWMVAFREDKRALHDLIAGTVVVQR
ncbi:MAG: RDD family protein [Chloroflexi bacterium]|nr:RDD family protein [Chloroflexota bacterium]MDA1175273.1 RDD family protein [Chloroflexota bacterium]